MSQQTPDAVFLIHGTFAHRAEDLFEPDPLDAERIAAWWQVNGAFVESLDGLLEGRAACWPEDVCQDMPWAKASPSSRLEGWTLLGRRPLGWLRPRYRIGNRRLFAWSGLNSESERRLAGRRLFQGLRALERENRARIAAGEPPRHYHLVGHSHGGSVIWNALRIAAGRQEGLPHLRSWTTLGTPFPTYRPVRYQWLVGSLGLMLIAGVGWLKLRGVVSEIPRPIRWGEAWMTLQALLDPRSRANLIPFGVSPATVAFLAIVTALAAGFAVSIVTWLYRTLESWLERRASDEAWRRFGGRWLGLFSELDEAIAGTQNTVGLYASDLVRLPSPGPLPLPRAWNPPELLIALPIRLTFWLVSLLAVPLINGVALPMAEWVISLVFRLKFQGSDRLGSYLTLTSPEPFARAKFPDGPGRGPLPPSLEAPLLEHARTDVDARMLVIRSRFAADARSPRSPRELLRSYFADLKVTGELIHNAYYQVDVLRRAVAYHILRSRSGDGPELDDRLAPPPEARAWLDGEVPGPSDLGYLPRPKPPSATPARTRVLLAAALGTLCLAAFHGLQADIHGVYINRLAQSAAMPEGRSRGLRRAFAAFRPYSEDRLVKLIAQGDVETRRRGVEFLTEFARMARARQDTGSTTSGPAVLEARTIDSLVRLAFDENTDRVLRTSLVEALMDAPDHGLVADHIVRCCLAPLAAGHRIGLGRPDPSGVGACLMIRHLGPDAVPPIRTILSERREPSQVCAAAVALGAIGAPEATPAIEDLIEELVEGHPEPSVHLAVADALRAIGAPADRRLIGRMMQDLDDSRDRSLRAMAARVLAKIGEPAADRGVIDRLIATLEDRDPEVRVAAEEALGRMGPKAIAPLTAATRRRITRPLASSALKAIADRERGPAHPPDATASARRPRGTPRAPGADRAAAAHARGRTGTAKGGPTVELLGTHPNGPTEVMKAPGRGGATATSQDVGSLVEALEHKHEGGGARIAAAKALGALGAEAARAVGPLIAIIENRHEGRNVRMAAARALGGIGAAGGDRAVVALLRVLGDREVADEEALEDASESDDARGDYPFVRIAATEALGALGAMAAPRAVGPLVQALEDPIEVRSVRQAVARALGALGATAAPRAASPLVKALDDPGIRDAAATALGGMKDLPREAEDLLIAALGRADIDTRAAVATVLAARGMPARPAEPLLIDLVITGDQHARHEAVKALEAIGFVDRPKGPRTP